MEPTVGSVVISKAGRDKGYYLTVLALTETDCLVADGKERPIERPKRKNRRHLNVTGYCLLPEQMAANSRLRRALSALRLGDTPSDKQEGESACQKKI